MFQAVEKDFGSVGSGSLSVGVLRDEVIPAVQGEFYSYSTRFTRNRPLYVLMKCKANKDRSIADARNLGREANLLFVFGDQGDVQVCEVAVSAELGLLGPGVRGEMFGETRIAPVPITAESFYQLRSGQDVQAMVEVCRVACSGPMSIIPLEVGRVIAMMTDAGKYGLFTVRKITQESIQIDACHILL